MTIQSLQELHETVEKDAITRIDLNDNNIGLEGAMSLASALRSCRRLRELSLNGNGIGSEGAVIVASALQDCESVERLHLCNNNIGQAAVKFVKDTLSHVEDIQTEENEVDQEEELRQLPSLLARVAGLCRQVHTLQECISWAAQTGAEINAAVSRAEGPLADCPLDAVSAIIERAAADRENVKRIVLAALHTLEANVDLEDALAAAQSQVLESENAEGEARKEREEFISDLHLSVIEEQGELLQAMVDGRRTLEEVSRCRSATATALATVLQPAWNLIEKERRESARLAVLRPHREVLFTMGENSEDESAHVKILAGLLQGVLQATAVMSGVRSQ